jgi:hypothetical protein
MEPPRGLGIVQVALRVQVEIAPDRLRAVLSEADRRVGHDLAENVERIVRAEGLGYYPAIEYFEGHPGMDVALMDLVKDVAAQVRKRVKREVQTHLWPVFSSLQIEQAESLAFTLPRISFSAKDASEKLAEHLFPNRVRLNLLLGTLDKHARLEEAESITSTKVVRNLRDVFVSVEVSAVRRSDGR